MKYLIESKLFYNAESGELIYIDIGVTEKHQLTKTANHILAILMASHGKVVSRQSSLRASLGIPWTRGIKFIFKPIY